MAQDRRQIDVWRRKDGAWNQTSDASGDAIVHASVGYELHVDELYDRAGIRIA